MCQLAQDKSESSVAIVRAYKRRPLWSRCTELTGFQLQVRIAAKILRIAAFCGEFGIFESETCGGFSGGNSSVIFARNNRLNISGGRGV